MYTSSPTTHFTGSVEHPGDTVVSVTVNGIPANLDGDDWSVDIPLDGNQIFNSVLVEADFERGVSIKERRTVVYGDGNTAEVLPEGAVLNNGVGLRINESSFTKLGPTIKQLTTIDPGAIAPSGTVVMDQCQKRVFGVCTVYVKAAISAPPSISDFNVGLDSQTGSVRALVNLYNFLLNLHVNARVLGVPVPCDLEITSDSIDVDGNYTLGPDPADPHLLDVNLVGTAPVVTLNGFGDDFVGGICSVPGIEQIVGLFVGDIQTMMRNNLTTMLGDPDGSGPVDSPVAEATEGALANIQIAGPIGDALGLNLESAITAADVDDVGLGLRATATFSANEVAPGAPDLTGSVGFGDVLDPIGSVTPGGLGYDVAVGASVTGFNQLLGAETERGLLNIDINELNGQPLTLKSLLDLIGAGGLVTVDAPVSIEMRPEVAPIITEAAGPGGSQAEFRLAGFRVTLKTTGPPAADVKLFKAVLDFRTGVSLNYVDGQLKFDLAVPAPADFHATVTENLFGVPNEVVEGALQSLTPQVFGAVQGQLPGFPLPSFVGMGLQPVEVGRVGAGLILYTNLVPGG
ncbi:MAG TPA: hypothetical protein VGJ86_17570 [Acidimicrobiales bacterium]